jgi:hypothetical protein
MKELDPPNATDVNGGLNPRPVEELPCTLPAKDPRIDVDYNPLPQPQ